MLELGPKLASTFQQQDNAGKRHLYVYRLLHIFQYSDSENGLNDFNYDDRYPLAPKTVQTNNRINHVNQFSWPQSC